MGQMFIGVDGKAKDIEKIFIGINGKATQIRKAYIGDENGKARLFYDYCYYYCQNCESEYPCDSEYPCTCEGECHCESQCACEPCLLCQGGDCQNCMGPCDVSMQH